MLWIGDAHLPESEAQIGGGGEAPAHYLWALERRGPDVGIGVNDELW